MRTHPITQALLCAALLAGAARADNDPCGSNPFSEECINYQLKKSFASGPFNPISSAPQITSLPELAQPAIDAIGASVQVSADGTSVSAVFAPAGLFLDEYLPFVSDFRLQLTSTAGTALVPPTTGFQASLGYTSNANAFNLTPEEVAKSRKECADQLDLRADPDLIWKAADVLRADLINAENAYRSRISDAAPVGIPEAIEGVGLTQENLAARVDQYAGRIATAWKNWRTLRKDASPLERRDGNTDLDALSKMQRLNHQAFGDCLTQSLAPKRIAALYHRAISFRIGGGATFFPFVSGPSYNPDLTNYRMPPQQSAIASINAGLWVNYFHNENTQVYVLGAYSTARATPLTLDSNTRLGLGGGFAIIAPSWPADKNGFRKGFAYGFDFGYSNCQGAAAGCSIVVVGYPQPALYDHVFVATPYIDVRAAANLTFRVAVPVTNFVLATPIPGSDGSTHVRIIVPTISATVASWSL